MTVDQTGVVDFLGVDKTSGEVNLTISDHFVWDENEGEHLLLLQEKINFYLAFILDGQLHTDFPHLQNKPVTIRLFGAYPLSEQAQRFFDLAKGRIEEAGVQLKFKLLPMDDSFGRAVVPALELD
jgi:hypothetical protein